MVSDEKKFKSRKFIVTMMGMWMLFILAVAAMALKVSPDATAMMGIAGGMGAYQWANVKWAANGNGISQPEIRADALARRT